MHPPVLDLYAPDEDLRSVRDEERSLQVWDLAFSLVNTVKHQYAISRSSSGK